MNFNKLIPLSILLGFNAHGACLDDAETTQSMSDCYTVELKVEERELDTMLNKAYKESSWITEEIKQSQVAWLQYRNAHCNAVYAYYERGTMRFIAHPSCMVELTRQRNNQIYTNFVKD
jgi:uncharacterized protein YecT (DUF1311 family)